MFEQKNISVGLVVLGSDQRYLKVNQAFCRMTEYGQEDLLLRSFIDILHPDDRERNAQITKRLVNGQIASSKWRTRFITRAGRILDANVTAVAARGDSSQSIQTLAMIERILDEKQDENSACTDALVAVGKSAAMLVHEISNELSGLSFPVALLERQMASRQLQGNHALLPLIRELRAGIDQVSVLLKDLGSFTRPQKLKLKPTDLVDFLAELLARLQSQYAAKGVRVDLDVWTALPAVVIDRQKFKQAVLNLCKNSVEAMPHGGTLTVRAYDSGRAICLDFKDTGIGIPSGLDVFKLFTTSKSEGTGLGLAIVRQIITAHGGKITYTSQEHKGTTFRVVLPKDIVLQESSTDLPPLRMRQLDYKISANENCTRKSNRMRQHRLPAQW